MKKLIIPIIALLLMVSPVMAFQTFYPQQGGTGTGTAPTYGQLLVGNASGLYTPTATSTLNIAYSDLVSVPNTFAVDYNATTTLNGFTPSDYLLTSVFNSTTTWANDLTISGSATTTGDFTVLGSNRFNLTPTVVTTFADYDTGSANTTRASLIENLNEFAGGQIIIPTLQGTPCIFEDCTNSGVGLKGNLVTIATENEPPGISFFTIDFASSAGITFNPMTEDLAFENAPNGYTFDNNVVITGNSTTTDSLYVGGYASSTIGFFTQGDGHFGGNLEVEGVLSKSGSTYVNPDYVFNCYFDNECGDYKSMTIEQTLDYVKDNRHLPNLNDVKPDESFDIVERQRIQTEKIEEMFLYISELEQRISSLEDSGIPLRDEKTNHWYLLGLLGLLGLIKRKNI